MPLRTWKCELCGHQRESFKKAPTCNHNQEEEGTPVPVLEMVQIITAPGTKFMEKPDPDRDKSQMVGQTTMLRERARKHSRDVEMHDLIQMNDRDTAHQNNWLKTDGTVRKNMDDK